MRSHSIAGTTRKGDRMETPGQMSIYDFCEELQHRTMNDWWTAERKGQEFLFSKTELQEEQNRQGGFLRFYFHTDGKKCCGCYPLLRQIHKGFKDLSYCQCLVCGRKTEPVDDYSWTDTKRQWAKMMEEQNGD